MTARYCLSCKKLVVFICEDKGKHRCPHCSCEYVTADEVWRRMSPNTDLMPVFNKKGDDDEATNSVGNEEERGVGGTQLGDVIADEFNDSASDNLIASDVADNELCKSNIRFPSKEQAERFCRLIEKAKEEAIEECKGNIFRHEEQSPLTGKNECFTGVADNELWKTSATAKHNGLTDNEVRIAKEFCKHLPNAIDLPRRGDPAPTRGPESGRDSPASEESEGTVELKWKKIKIKPYDKSLVGRVIKSVDDDDLCVRVKYVGSTILVGDVGNTIDSIAHSEASFSFCGEAWLVWGNDEDNHIAASPSHRCSQT